MVFVFGIFGLIAGVFGGMGMGGGTLLIPLLTIFLNVGQHSAQAINLISFIPMAVIALIIHLKNNLVEFKDVFLIIISGIVSCFVGCYIARAVSGVILKKIFGGFLVVLSVIQVILGLKRINKQ